MTLHDLTTEEQQRIDGGILICSPDPMPVDPYVIIVPIDGSTPTWPPITWPPINPGCW